jgi:putative ABC transport system permease protein
VTPLRLAVLSLLRRRLSTYIALLAIALPIASGSILLRLNELSGSRFSTIDQSFDAAIGAKAGELEILLGALNGEGGAYPDWFTYNLFDSILDRHVASHPSTNPKRALFLRSAIPLTIFGKFAGHRVIGTEKSYWIRPPRESSPVFIDGRAPEEIGEVAISEKLAGQQGLQIGDGLAAEAWVSNDEAKNKQQPKIDLTVVGIVKDTGLFWDRVVLADMTQARVVISGLEKSGDLHPVWKEKVVHYALFNADPGGLQHLRNLVNNGTIAQMVNVRDQVSKLEDLTGNGQTLGLIVTGMILLLGALAVTGIMVTRFDAMMSQFSVLRAIGYSLPELSAWLLAEALLLGVVAVVIGALLDYLGFPWFRDLAQSIVPSDQRMTIPLWKSAPIWLAATIATLLATCFPLIRLYRNDVHRTLRGL